MKIFRKRSEGIELLDDPLMPEADIHMNLKELDVINRWLGGHRTTITGLRKLIGDLEGEISITDIGCGGGDTLAAIRRWGINSGLSLRLRGVDLLPAAISYARKRKDLQDTELIEADVFRMEDDHLRSDILICNMVWHHMKDEELARLVGKMNRCAGTGWVVNDLHRHPMAYYGIQGITKLLSRSHLVKHDAPLSVLRGFSFNELRDLLATGAPKSSISWEWAFRFLVVNKVDKNGR